MREYSAIANPQLQCTHIQPDGHRCGSFALRGDRFCFHHHPERPASRRQRAKAAAGPSAPFSLPPLINQRAIQIAIAEIAIRIADNTLDPQRASLLLQCIQSARAATHTGPHMA